MKSGTFIVYRISDANGVFYVGRTTQTIKARMRQHMTSSSDVPHIDPSSVKKIEFALCKSEADMYLYEVYYINLYRPQLNEDAKAMDCLTVCLPELNWIPYMFITELKKWEVMYAESMTEITNAAQKKSLLDRTIDDYCRKYESGIITLEERDALIKQAVSIIGG